MKEKRPLDKSVLSFFMIGFPTVVIIILGVLLKQESSFTVAAIQIVLAIYQFITLKQFLDNYYELIEA